MPVRKPAIVRHVEAPLQKERMQDDTADLGRTLRACPFIIGRLKSVRFDGGNKVVNHGLGRPAAWIVVRSYEPGQGPGPITESSDQTGLDPKNQIRIFAHDVMVADLWFYPRASRPINLTTGQSE